ncbi:flagellar assembly protein FliW [Thauera sp. CAU 1555]|uniref:Flagellar assembly factor FliW n=1 Tax=Thauera sedimentorum TaxID=2767595 RepID=A0ABR9BAY9_9RHOO|nr:flagellar assembly protein FliW [Thauera sedimentorum]MBC9072599.1 flagellar assembly protein FliW [Thauera sedimentorum]MBD8503518.1 flagellar assembly protein FliW [Thauera sedimentorum]
MKIESAQFGTFEVAEDKLIEFPAGLPGFEDCKRFALVHEEGADAVELLQSVDDPEVVFALADPASFGIHYEFKLTDDEQAALGLNSPEQALVAVIVRKDEAGEGSPASAGLRANFMAPLVINVEARRGLQKVINKMECDITMRAKD